jgi:hypothetical protein
MSLVRTDRIWRTYEHGGAHPPYDKHDYRGEWRNEGAFSRGSGPMEIDTYRYYERPPTMRASSPRSAVRASSPRSAVRASSPRSAVRASSPRTTAASIRQSIGAGLPPTLGGGMGFYYDDLEMTQPTYPLRSSVRSSASRGSAAGAGLPPTLGGGMGFYYDDLEMTQPTYPLRSSAAGRGMSPGSSPYTSRRLSVQPGRGASAGRSSAGRSSAGRSSAGRSSAGRSKAPQSMSNRQIQRQRWWSMAGNM